MMNMNPKSASALAWAAAIATLVGLMGLSPGARFISFLVAAVLAIVPTLFGTRVPRVLGGALLAISLVLAYQGYPAFSKEMADYRNRVKAPAGHNSAPSPVEQQGKK